jgi:hypothetical protein
LQAYIKDAIPQKGKPIVVLFNELASSYSAAAAELREESLTIVSSQTKANFFSLIWRGAGGIRTSGLSL